MTESQNNTVSGSNTKPASKRPSFFLGFVMVMTMLLVAGATVAFWHHLKKSEETNTSSTTVTAPVISPAGSASGKTAIIEDKIEQIQVRLSDLTKRVENLEQQAATDVVQTNETGSAVFDSAGVGQLKGQVMNLATAIGALESFVKQIADETRTSTQDSLAISIAFTQLRTAANSGEPFTTELQTFKSLATDNSELLSLIARIEPLAVTGAPPISVLQTEFATHIGAVHAAMRKAEAETWQDRIKAELEGLVSIRRLDSSAETSDPIANINNDLKRQNLTSALERFEALPEPAKAILRDWRSRAEGKHSLITTLNEIASQVTHGLSARPNNMPVP